MLGGLELPSAAQSNLVPPAFPVPEMAVTLQSFEVGGRKLRGRKELLRIGGGGGATEKGVLGAGTLWVTNHFLFRLALGK